MGIRGNQVLWRLARHLFDNFDDDALNGEFGGWAYFEYTRNWYYDKASVLYAKVIGNDFTGPDLHKD